MASGLVYDIQRFSVHDGPGIRTTAFFKGCPLDCWWCHNPESIAPYREVIFRSDKCIGCGACTDACPGELPGDERLSGPGECHLCGACCDSCPTGAREMVGEKMTPGELCRELEKDRVFYEQSGGGVTFSGGEPLAQPEFLLASLRECVRRGIRTAVDTSGCADPDVLDQVADEADILLYDIKHTDDRAHRKYVGVSNRQILDNLQRLVRRRGGGDVIARLPLIPRINDDPENLSAVGQLLADLGIRWLHLLPYHRAGTEKYPLLNKQNRLSNLTPPGSEDIGAAKDRLQKYGICVRTGG